MSDAAAQPADDILATTAAGPAAVRGGAIRVVGYVAGALLSAGSAGILFRHLGVTRDAGLYVTALSLVALVAGISDLGLTAVGVRELARRSPQDGALLAGDVLGLRLTITVAGVAVMTAIAAVGYPSVLVAGVALAGAGILLQAIQDNLAMRLTAELRLGWVAALDLMRQVLTVALIVTFALLGARLLAFLTISIPVGAVLLAAALRVVRGERRLRPTFNLGRWRALVMPLLPYSLAVAAGAFYFRLAVIVVGLLSTGLQLSLYGAPFRMIEVATVVPALVAGSAFPIFARAARDDRERLRYALGKVFDTALLVGAWVAISIAVGASVAVAVILGSQYQAAVDVFRVQGLALGALFVNSVWSYGLLSLSLHRDILLINLAAVAALAGLLVLVVPAGGALGAAWATTAVEVALVAVNGAVLLGPRPALRPSWRIVPRVAAAALAGLAPLLLGGIPAAVRLLISSAFYLLVLVMLRALPAELLAALPGRAGRRLGGAP